VVHYRGGLVHRVSHECSVGGSPFHPVEVPGHFDSQLSSAAGVPAWIIVITEGHSEVTQRGVLG
jgi:hypothetical protein